MPAYASIARQLSARSSLSILSHSFSPPAALVITSCGLTSGLMNPSSRNLANRLSRSAPGPSSYTPLYGSRSASEHCSGQCGAENGRKAKKGCWSVLLSSLLSLPIGIAEEGGGVGLVPLRSRRYRMRLSA